MSEPKFTPGPWRVGKSIYQSQARVVAEKGGRVSDVFAYEEDQAHANAALIATAPEMYDLLEWMFKQFDASDSEEMVALGWKIEELLKKARGEE